MSDRTTQQDPADRSGEHADGDETRQDTGSEQVPPGGSGNPSTTQTVPGEQPVDDPDLEGEDRFDAG
ncbi:hypothetical protein [Cellulosimicrobium sp. NPDC057127]|uniref:hypothetical protein n=1 Tax=Cellulosimicrobium sp. NPDC057127 TaxID=3346026 RepID=UPI0036363870